MSRGQKLSGCIITSVSILYFFILLSPTIALCETLSAGPFARIDLATLPEEAAIVLREANEDFVLVQEGHKPRHAHFDSEAALPSDGGTTYYNGRKYTLTIVKSISTFGNLAGYIYGPNIEFEKGFALGNFYEVSSLRFYTAERLNALLNKNEEQEQ